MEEGSDRGSGRVGSDCWSAIEFVSIRYLKIILAPSCGGKRKTKLKFAQKFKG